MVRLSISRPGWTVSLPLSRRGAVKPWGLPANVSAAMRAELNSLVGWLAGFVAIAVLISLGHVWLRLKVVDFGYHLSASRQIIERLRDERSVLQARLEALRSPQRIAGEAGARLGMVRPVKGQEFVLP